MSGLLERISRRRRVAPSAETAAGPENAASAEPVAPTEAVAATGPGAPKAAAARALEVANDADGSAADVRPGFRERGALRRRARYLRQLREIQLRDIGGLTLELHRFGRERPDLVQAKIAVASSTVGELRALEQALAEGQSLRELREPGIGGACRACGAVHGSGDRFCCFCGEPLTHRTAVGEPESDQR